MVIAGWMPVGFGQNSSYEIIEGDFTWHEAKVDAEARGGHLAVITSESENIEIAQITGSKSLWIGATDEGSEGEWKWVTGEEWSYNNWDVSSGEPSNSGGAEHSLVFTYLSVHFPTSVVGEWHDVNTISKRGYVLELSNEIVLENALVAYYPFNGNANDESGNGHDGTMLDGGILTQDRLGENNTALSLDNNDFRVQFEGLEPFAPTTTQGMSVSFWATKDVNATILSQYPEPPSNNSFFINIENNNNWNIAGNGIGTFTGNAELSKTLWQHWVVQISPGENGTKVFLNGSFQKSGSLNLNPNETSSPFYIGQLGGRPRPEEGRGALDDIRIYNRALSEAEVADLYELEKSKTGPGTLLWSFKTGGWVDSSPAIGGDGTVYVGSDDNKVYALDGKIGTEKWVFQTEHVVYSTPSIGPDGMVYVGSGDNNIYALDPNTGDKKWETNLGHGVTSSPAIGLDGTIYVGSLNDWVYAIDGQTGEKKWEYRTGNSIYCGVALGSNGYVYLGSQDGNVYAIDSQTGEKKWEFQTDGYLITTSPAIGSDGSIYIGGRSSKKVYR